MAEVEDENIEEPTSPTSPIAPYPPHQNTGYEKSREPEFYGFVAWILTALVFVVYFLWATIPDEWLHYVGITWYPKREWAILIPAYTIVIAIVTYWTYWALALYATPALDSLYTITDLQAHVPELTDGPHPFLAIATSESFPVAYDIPISMVNRVLYRKETIISDD